MHIMAGSLICISVCVQRSPLRVSVIPCLSFDHWLLQHLLFWTYSHKENQPLLLTLPWSRGVVCRHNALRVTCTSGSACRDLGYRGYLSEG